MEKFNRDEIIEKKLQELNNKKEKIENDIKSSSIYKTNIRLNLTEKSDTIILRVIKSKEKLIWILGELIFLRNKWNTAILECCPDKKEELFECNVSGYKISEWIEDIKTLIKKVELEKEIEKINKAILDLPKFYSSEKKNDIEFEKLMRSIE